MPDSPMTVEQLQRMLWSFAEHRVITVAGKLGVLTLLTERIASSAEAASELSLDPEATDKLIRALHALGLVETAGGGYRVAASMGDLFLPGTSSLLPFLEHSHHLYDSWAASLEPWVKGEPWERHKRDEDGLERFGAAMEAMGSRVARGVAEHLELKGARKSIDFGGGFGHYSKALLAKWFSLHATVLDIPEVARIGSRRAASTPFAERLEFVAGDYLETRCGDDFDIALLMNVLHQERPDRARALVANAAAHLRPGGQLAIVDFAIDDEKKHHRLGTLFALNMRSFGDTYSEPEIREWLASCGIRHIKRIDLNPDRWLLVGRKL